MEEHDCCFPLKKTEVEKWTWKLGNIPDILSQNAHIKKTKRQRRRGEKKRHKTEPLSPSQSLRGVQRNALNKPSTANMAETKSLLIKNTSLLFSDRLCQHKHIFLSTGSFCLSRPVCKPRGHAGGGCRFSKCHNLLLQKSHFSLL